MEFNKKNVRQIMLIIVFAAAVLTISQNIPAVVFGIKTAYSFVSPVVLGLVIAFVLNVFLKMFEEKVFKGLKKSKKKHIRAMVRPISIAATLLCALGILTIVILVVFPELENLFNTLSSALPQFMDSVRQWLEGIFERFNINAQSLQEISINWESIINKLASSFMKGSEAFIGTASSAASGVISFGTNLVLGFVISIYVLAQKEQIGRFVSALLGSLLPSKAIDEIFRISRLTNDIFSKFIIGQLTEAIILGALCFAGMLIFRFPYAVVISVFISLTALIPVVGAFLGGAVGSVLIFMISPVKALLFLLFLTVLQQLEGDFIYPKVVGKTVGLPSLLVLVAIVIGGNIGGITGMLLSVPVAAEAYILLKEFITKHKGGKKVK